MIRKAALALGSGLLLALPVGASAQDQSRVIEGARVWAQNCTRCHNVRASVERSDRDWVTVIAHMRARANLTRTESLLVGAFLQQTNEPVLQTEPEISPPAPDAESGVARGSPLSAVSLPAAQLAALHAYLRALQRPR